MLQPRATRVARRMQRHIQIDRVDEIGRRPVVLEQNGLRFRGISWKRPLCLGRAGITAAVAAIVRPSPAAAKRFSSPITPLPGLTARVARARRGDYSLQNPAARKEPPDDRTLRPLQGAEICPAARRACSHVMSNPGKLNALGSGRRIARLSRSLARHRPRSRDVGCHPARRGNAFSAGGDMSMVEEMHERFRGARARVARGARPRLQRHQLLEADRRRRSTARRSAPASSAALLADISIAAKTARIIDGHTRLGVAAGDHAAIIWPLLCGMAKAKYYLLHLRAGDRRGGRADRPRVARASTKTSWTKRRSEVARKLAAGPQTAIRWTK